MRPSEIELSVVSPVYDSPEPPKELVSGIVAAARELVVIDGIIWFSDAPASRCCERAMAGPALDKTRRLAN